MEGKKCRICGENDAAHHRTICYKCKIALNRKRHPVKAAYDILKMNAQRRFKEFGLSFDEFRQFCQQTNYIELKGRGTGFMSIDRIKNDRGYFIDNLQILKFEDNSRKHTKEFIEVFGSAPEIIPF